MLGVMLGGYHSFYDLGLLLAEYPAITPPAPKTKFVDIPGTDGALDMSKALTGYMMYNRRTITMTFSIMGQRSEWPEIHSDIMDKLHGLETEIICDDDQEHAYIGLLSVSSYDPKKVTSGVTITADVEPYKRRLTSTRRSFTISGSYTASVTGSRAPAVPVITASKAMQMTFVGKTYSLAAGENTLPDVVIREGVNTFVFKGSGTVQLEYREGRF